ncbi:MAG: hypothetical protein IPG09_15310 [Ignavibacteria bacterium]|nr:hypothetical protein [Ignavibacteria bacterium]
MRIRKQSSGPPTGPPVNIEISGDDFVKLGQIIRRSEKSYENVSRYKDLKDDFDEARPEIEISI